MEHPLFKHDNVFYRVKIGDLNSCKVKTILTPDFRLVYGLFLILKTPEQGTLPRGGAFSTVA